MSETALAKQEGEFSARTVRDLREQVNLIQEAMRDVMKEGEHFGTIPGCGEKKTLLKPGAEKLAFLFRIAPSFEITETLDPDGHYTVGTKCVLRNIASQAVVGEGWGLCTTKESKYAYRKKERECPDCGAEAIIKGKAEYGGGWLCWAKKGGCGAKFDDNAPEILGQQTDRVPNPDLPDCYNPVLKISNKRALVAAILVSTAASDIFTQDIEDMGDPPPEREPDPPPRQAAPLPRQAPPAKGRMARGAPSAQRQAPQEVKQPSKPAAAPPTQDREAIVRLRTYLPRLKESGLEWRTYVKGDPHKMTDEALEAVMHQMEDAIAEAFERSAIQEESAPTEMPPAAAGAESEQLREELYAEWAQIRGKLNGEQIIRVRTQAHVEYVNMKCTLQELERVVQAAREILGAAA